MNIAVLRETEAGEARVALMPDSVQKLIAQKASVSIESGAGLGAARTDDDYREAGATVSEDRNALLASADILVVINRPSKEDFNSLKPSAVVLGFLRPLDEPAELVPALEHGLTNFAMELVPRITRAQSMDALSSMATVAGYKAVLLGANRIPRMFPLLMTAAGTVPPARGHQQGKHARDSISAQQNCFVTRNSRHRRQCIHRLRASDARHQLHGESC